jgi:hypothetical protein
MNNRVARAEFVLFVVLVGVVVVVCGIGGFLEE